MIRKRLFPHEGIKSGARGLLRVMVDFKKQLGGKKSFARLTDPLEIYETLDRASDKGPLRPAQKAILEEWYREKRNARDVIVKMHNGPGQDFNWVDDSSIEAK